MPKINNSVARALSMLQLIKDAETPRTLSEISEALKIPKSSAFDIICTLHAAGFLEYGDDRLKTYVLGIKAFEVGSAYINKAELVPTANPFLNRIMENTGATAFLAIENNGELVYLDKVEAETSIRTTAMLGSRINMCCTGLGKALLATYDEKRLDTFLNQAQFVRYTPYTIMNANDLRLELQKTRERGYAIDNREREEIQYCVAVPVRNNANTAVAAISVALMYAKVTPQLEKEYSELLMSCAMQISRKLGYLGASLF